jgi:ribonuclease Z
MSADPSCDPEIAAVSAEDEPALCDRGSRSAFKVGPFRATLLNGVFGDPVLHVRLPHRRRSLLIDIGQGGRLPARLAHQVCDVCISHAHIDHIGGFLSFLRTRIGEFPPCRVFGPPRISDNVAALVAGVHWDRAGSRAPRFDVTELNDGELERFRVRAGRRDPEPAGRQSSPDGVVFDDDLMRIRAVTLDHLTPVLAFALEPKLTINVRKERLSESGLAPGPWLTELKNRISAGDRGHEIDLPDGSRATVAALAERFATIGPGEKLVYATDLADTSDNRRRLIGLAAGAHTFFCEATFREADADKALRTGHLTTRACAEIAAAAGVGNLVPFHFSRRYEDVPARVLEEIVALCPETRVRSLVSE